MGCWVSRTEAVTPARPSADASVHSGVGGLNSMPITELPHSRALHVLYSTKSAEPTAVAGTGAILSSSSQSAAQFAESGSSSNCRPNKLCCDKCDGPHATDSCPHYKKKREDHPDGSNPPSPVPCSRQLATSSSDRHCAAWRHFGRKPKDMGSDGGNFIVANARVIRQPGDGSCLFHSLAHGLGDGTSALQVRLRVVVDVQACCDRLRS